MHGRKALMAKGSLLQRYTLQKGGYKLQSSTITLIICVLADLMWISSALGRYKKKNWDTGLDKFVDYFILFVGIPFIIFVIVKFIISLNISAFWTGICRGEVRMGKNSITYLLCFAGEIMLLCSAMIEHRRNNRNSGFFKFYYYFSIFLGIPLIVLTAYLFLKTL